MAPRYSGSRKPAAVIMVVLLLGLLTAPFWIFGAADNTQVDFVGHQISPEAAVNDTVYIPSETNQAFIEHAVRNGTSRRVSLGTAPFFSDVPPHQLHDHNGTPFVYFRHSGVFYRIAVANVSARQTQRQTLELVRVNETPRNAIRIEDLPEVDQRAVDEAETLKYRANCKKQGWPPDQRRCWSVYSRHDANQSVLVGSSSPEYVLLHNQTFRLVVRERTVNGTAFTYEATPVASNPNKFLSMTVVDVEEDDLSADERQLLEEAIGEGYHIKVYRHDIKEVPRDRFNRLLPKLGLPTFDELSQSHHGTSVGIITYQGRFYRIQIEYHDTYA